MVALVVVAVMEKSEEIARLCELQFSEVGVDYED